MTRIGIGITSTPSRPAHLELCLSQMNKYMPEDAMLFVAHDTNKMGVATTYAKRYQLGSMIGVNADEDTDGSYGDNSGLKTTASKPNISEKQFKEALSRASDPLLLENIFKTYMLTAEQKTQLNKEAGI